MAEPSTVLLVEADVIIRHPLAEYLRECGLRVIEAANGDEARQALTDPGIAIDFVLVDVSTPGAGFALVQWLRAGRPDIDVELAGSLEASAEKAGELCREGSRLTKPYEHRLVLERIRQRIAARRGSRA